MLAIKTLNRIQPEAEIVAMIYYSIIVFELKKQVVQYNHSTLQHARSMIWY